MGKRKANADRRAPMKGEIGLVFACEFHTKINKLPLGSMNGKGEVGGFRWGYFGFGVGELELWARAKEKAPADGRQTLDLLPRPTRTHTLAKTTSFSSCVCVCVLGKT